MQDRRADRKEERGNQMFESHESWFQIPYHPINTSPLTNPFDVGYKRYQTRLDIWHSQEGGLRNDTVTFLKAWLIFVPSSWKSWFVNVLKNMFDLAVQKWRLTKKPKSWNFRAIFAGTHSPGKTGEVWDSKWSTSSDYIDATRAHMLSGRKIEIRVLLTLIQNGNNCHTNWSFCTGPNFSGKIDQQQPKEINSQSSESFLVIKIEIWGFECMESRTR